MVLVMHALEVMHGILESERFSFFFLLADERDLKWYQLASCTHRVDHHSLEL